MNKLIIIGASGHGKVAADIALKSGYTDIAFLDDNETLQECAGFPVLGATSLAPSLLNTCDFFVAIGNTKMRHCILESLGDHVVTLIHPQAVISRRVTIGAGSVIMAGAVINSDTALGKGCIVNTGASIDHDCQVADYVHISVGAHVAGTVQLGTNTWVGIGAAIVNNVSICSDCTIGAGAAVINSINKPGTYVGVPARLKNEL